MTVFEVRRLFSNVVCPYCNEKIDFEKNESPIAEHVTKFETFVLKENASDECAKFNQLLNTQLLSLEDGRITELQIREWLAQFVQ